MRLAAVLLLTHPTLLLIGTAMRAIRFDIVEAALALVALTGAAALGTAIWQRRPSAYWLAVLAAVGWITAQGLLVIVIIREAAGLSVGELATQLTGPLASALLAAAALALLLGGPAAHARTSSEAQYGRRVVVATLIAEGILLTAICTLGFAMFIEDEPWYRYVLAMTQVPGIMLLALLNQCCGLAGGIVLSDFVEPRWGGLLPTGVPIMGFANAVAVAGTAIGTRALLHRFRAARQAAAPEVAS